MSMYNRYPCITKHVDLPIILLFMQITAVLRKCIAYNMKKHNISTIKVLMDVNKYIAHTVNNVGNDYTPNRRH